MDPASLLAACALHAQALNAQAQQAGAARPCPEVGASAAPASAPATPISSSPLAALLNAPEARDAMARVVYAEAGNQGDSGLAAVVYTIINRLQDGRWGSTVEAVVDAPHQFEPVMRAGGSWRRLAPVSVAEEARVNTIVNLALQGRLPDLTGGARYFQNRAVVAARAAAGQVAQGLVGFGGAIPSAQIGAHTFYTSVGEARGSGQHSRALPTPGDIFFGENHAADQAPDPLATPTAADPPAAPSAPPSGAQTQQPGGIFFGPAASSNP